MVGEMTAATRTEKARPQSSVRVNPVDRDEADDHPAARAQHHGTRSGEQRPWIGKQHGGWRCSARMHRGKPSRVARRWSRRAKEHRAEGREGATRIPDSGMEDAEGGRGRRGQGASHARQQESSSTIEARDRGELGWSTTQGGSCANSKQWYNEVEEEGCLVEESSARGRARRPWRARSRNQRLPWRAQGLAGGSSRRRGSWRLSRAAAPRKIQRKMSAT